MSTFVTDGVSLHYEELGSGFPLLLLAPGGLNSTIDAWSRAALNPLERLADDFHLIAMDQRNAGSSTGPFDPVDPWGSFVRDQVALVRHLGFDRFLAMGCCIGCSYALKMSAIAPDHLVAAVLEQPIGLTNHNRDTWLTNGRSWVSNLAAHRPELDERTGEAFATAMWSDGDFVVSVSRDFLLSCPTPLLVLPGVDAMHPHETGEEIARLAPDAIVVDPWRDSSAALGHATDEVRRFLLNYAQHAQ